MKILKLIASVVLLGFLAVSTASAATVTVDRDQTPAVSLTSTNVYEAVNLLAGANVDDMGLGTFTHTYEFEATSAFTVLTDLRVIVGGGGQTGINNLKFEWTPVFLDEATITSTGGIVDYTDMLLSFSVASGQKVNLVVTGDVTKLGSAYDFTISAVPLPAAFWLFGSALVGFVGFSRRKAGMRQA